MKNIYLSESMQKPLSTTWQGAMLGQEITEVILKYGFIITFSSLFARMWRKLCNFAPVNRKENEKT